MRERTIVLAYFYTLLAVGVLVMLVGGFFATIHTVFGAITFLVGLAVVWQSISFRRKAKEKGVI